jgi:hypothetical protein
MKAQGATEYLVLLAVVLIIALVSVALLGFFPGMASDAQLTQSQMYWRSATPIEIVDSSARAYSVDGTTYLYFRFKNSGPYPLRITGIVGADGAAVTQFRGYNCSLSYPPQSNISDHFYLAPGEEKYLGASAWFGTYCNWRIYGKTGSTVAANWVGGASSVCQNSSTSPGTLSYKSFGFEYIIYMEGQQITKRQIGKELIIKCIEPV